MLQIDRNSWHARIFRWYHQDYYRRHVNLCPYVRTVLLWAPGKWLLTRPRVWFALPVLAAVVTWLVYVKWGWLGLVGEAHLLILFLAVFGGAAALTGFFYSLPYLFDKKHGKFATFREVLSARTSAYHDRICPIVSFSASDSRTGDENE